jgi:tRNA U34 5-methylaminomethyl-2-thiouridine-forming methyltransferase MnmC
MNASTPSAPAYELVELANGTRSIRSVAEGETFHPVIGPVAEAEALYIRQLRLVERVEAAAAAGRGFVLWDVGLGSAANVATALRHLGSVRGSLHVVSFDHTLAPLRFAREHALELGYPVGFESEYEALAERGSVRFRHGEIEVIWEVHVADFPTFMTGTVVLPAPDAIFYDAYSPARNAAMWTLPLFRAIHGRLDPARPCALATYSRATLLRVTLLRAGFWVGAGEATGEKEETTLAANVSELVGRPLDSAWLLRASRSTSAEPLLLPAYRQAPLSPESAAGLAAHPQFAGA